MFSINIYNVSIGFFLLYLGVYVFKMPPGANRAQKYFFWLCFALSLWMFGLGFRSLLPLEIRGIVLNWILIPVLFLPSLLDAVISSIKGDKLRFTRTRFFLNFLFLPYLLFVTSIGSAVKIQDHIQFSYLPTFNYHLIILYCGIYISISCVSIVRIMIRERGDKRVRAFLLLSGTLIALIVSVLCVYVFPLLGFFYASRTAFGLLPFSILWAVAILHYDAFEIRERILDGKELPFLNRISSLLVLGLFRILDPSEYSMRLLISKANVVLGVVSKNHELAMRTDLETLERAEMVAGVYYDRLK
ncbi:histidine kinase N-terminal 7TM domain-containing protein [Leptospira sp. WS92.C1]